MIRDPFSMLSPFETMAEARRERMMPAIINFMIVGLTPLIVIFLLLVILSRTWQTVVVAGITLSSIPVVLFTRYLTERNRIEFGGYLMIGYLMIMVNINGMLIDGVFPAVAPAMAPIIIIGGIILGPAGGIISATFAGILWTLSWSFFEAALIPMVTVPSLYVRILVFAIIILSFGFTAFTSLLATRDLKRALDDATYDLVQVNRDLAEANKLKSQFTARTSHELRTPLNAIKVSADLALRGIYGEYSRLMEEALDRIFRNSARLQSLIDDILDLSKLEAGQYILEEQSLEVQELVDVTELLMKPKADNKGLEFAVTVKENMPPMIHADEKRLSQVILNLTDNAIKFTKTGSVQVIIEPMDSEHWHILVRDTGRGISEKDYVSIFEAFQQGPEAARSSVQGTGLGLAITRHLVELMGGKMKVTSEIGVGSTFEAILPLDIE